MDLFPFGKLNCSCGGHPKWDVWISALETTKIVSRSCKSAGTVLEHHVGRPFGPTAGFTAIATRCCVERFGLGKLKCSCEGMTSSKMERLDFGFRDYDRHEPIVEISSNGTRTPRRTAAMFTARCCMDRFRIGKLKCSCGVIQNWTFGLGLWPISEISWTRSPSQMGDFAKITAASNEMRSNDVVRNWLLGSAEPHKLL